MLAATVERLRTEAEQLRATLRTSAVVEQAKGVLAERLGCGVDAAHSHLLELAAENDMSPVAAAALLLGQSLPADPDRAERAGDGSALFNPDAYLRSGPHPPGSPPGPGPVQMRVPVPRARRPVDRRATRRHDPGQPDAMRHLAAATFAAARTADELAANLCVDALGWLGARGVLLAAVEPDGALRVVGSHGVPPHVVSGWSRIPPDLGVGLVRTASSGLPSWPEGAGEPAAPGLGGARVCAPMTVAGRVVAAAEIMWPDGVTLDEEQRRYITAVTTACGQRLHALLGDGSFTPDRDTPWLRAVIDAVPGPAALISPVRDRAGRVIDFRVEACNADTTDTLGRGSDDLIGARLVEMYPGLAVSGLFDAYVRVLETGSPLRVGPKEFATLLDGRLLPTTMSVRACRIGDGLLVSWRFHADSDDLAAQLDQAQRLGNLGWSVWDLSTGHVRWSDQLYVIFGRDPADGPFGIDELAGRVLPEDLPVTEHMIRTLMERREPVDATLRIGRRGETRHVRLMAEPVLDAVGEPAALRCVYQDVTVPHRAARALETSRKQLERQRRRVAEEQRIAVELQRSVLPLPRGTFDKPGLAAAVRYLPAGSSARVGGDWYEATAMDGGGVFLAIGDVSGHGVTAAAAMARLRNALSGLAFTEADPDRLLRWLNQVVLHWPGTLTATVLAARYDPAARVLTWAQAGHLPPIVISDGKAIELEPPDGILLGACAEPDFAVATTPMCADDLLLLYTDGLIERRDRDLRAGLDLLVETASRQESADPERILDEVLEAFDAPNPNDDTCVLAVRIL